MSKKSEVKKCKTVKKVNEEFKSSIVLFNDDNKYGVQSIELQTLIDEDYGFDGMKLIISFLETSIKSASLIKLEIDSIGYITMIDPAVTWIENEQ